MMTYCNQYSFCYLVVEAIADRRWRIYKEEIKTEAHAWLLRLPDGQSAEGQTLGETLVTLCIAFAKKHNLPIALVKRSKMAELRGKSRKVPQPPPEPMPQGHAEPRGVFSFYDPLDPTSDGTDAGFEEMMKDLRKHAAKSMGIPPDFMKDTNFDMFFGHPINKFNKRNYPNT